MKRMRYSIMFVLILMFSSFCILSLVNINSSKGSETVYSMKYIGSTKEWQDMACDFLKRRNDVINGVLESKYSGNKKYISQLKSIECKPLLDGDIELLNYMSLKRDAFKNKKSGINIEYSDIRKLTDDEVAMAAKASFLEGGIYRETNYDIVFKMVHGKWMLSKLDLAQTGL